MTRIEINNILEVFRFVHMAAFSAYHHPNSFTSCCSFDSVGVEGHHMTGCDQNNADWRNQQRDEIKSYLPDTYCSTMNQRYCLLKGRPFTSDNRLGWIVYPVIRNSKPVLVISMYLPVKDKEKIWPEVIRGVINDPVYRQNLYGVGTQFEASWSPKPDFPNNPLRRLWPPPVPVLHFISICRLWINATRKLKNKKLNVDASCIYYSSFMGWQRVSWGF